RGVVNLDLEGSPTTAEVHQRGRFLRIELPIDQRYQRLYNVKDDAAAAGRAQHGKGPSLLIKHDGRCHRAARPLAGRNGVGERTAGAVDGAEGKVGELVVEQKAARPQTRA